MLDNDPDLDYVIEFYTDIIGTLMFYLLIFGGCIILYDRVNGLIKLKEADLKAMLLGL